MEQSSALRGITLPALLLLVYCFIFVPEWVVFQGDSHGPLYARRTFPTGSKYLQYVDHYHMSVYDPMATVLITGTAIMLLAVAQSVFAFVPAKSKRARDVVHLVLASVMFAMHTAGVAYTASAGTLTMQWGFYWGAVAGSLVTLANMVVAAILYRK